MFLLLSERSLAETRSIAKDKPTVPRERAEPQLFLIVQAHRPLDAAWRASLASADDVAIGRGDVTRVELAGDSPARLVIAVDDPWMSSAHARLSKALTRWRIEDAGSKNGTLVNGEPLVAARVLADGDVIEMGHTFFRYRDQVTVSPSDPPIASPLGKGLVTLLPPLQRQFADLERVAPTPVPIVIRGPSGTGKELVARAVHALSRRAGAFIPINCGALPETLVETELFGYRKGAFSGATQDRPGLIRSADTGTLFLDEVAELPAPAQVVFLRVLQEREVVPVGGSRPIAVDIRLISATHRDLDGLVAAGTVREDFFHRLTGFRIELPSLRERIEDLGLLLAALLERHAAGTDVTFEVEAMRCMLRYAWPGNVRELERSLIAALALAGGRPIATEHLGGIADALHAPPPAPDAAPDTRRERLIELMAAHRGNVAAVAREMGKAPMQIRRWLEQYGLDPDRFRR